MKYQLSTVCGNDHELMENILDTLEDLTSIAWSLLEEYSIDYLEENLELPLYTYYDKNYNDIMPDSWGEAIELLDILETDLMTLQAI
jgi:hypothetical protein